MKQEWKCPECGGSTQRTEDCDRCIASGVLHCKADPEVYGYEDKSECFWKANICTKCWENKNAKYKVEPPDPSQFWDDDDDVFDSIP